MLKAITIKASPPQRSSNTAQEFIWTAGYPPLCPLRHSRYSVSTMLLFVALPLVPGVQNGFLHFCCPQLHMSVYPVLRRGLPACVLREQVLNLRLWEGYGTKNELQEAVGRGICLNMETLNSVPQFAANFSLALPCCNVWQITPSQHWVLWGVHHLLQAGGLGATKIMHLKRKPVMQINTCIDIHGSLAVLCSTVYAFGMTYEVSPVFIYKCFDDNISMDLMFQLVLV